MFKRKNSSNDSNFWISYADLMAGLLFVFILLIGAIVSKSAILRQHLEKKEEALEKTSLELNKTAKRLQQTATALAQQANRVNRQNRIIKKQIATIKLKEDEINQLKALLEERSSDLNSTKAILAVTKDALKLKENEIKRLNQLLLARNSNIDKLNRKIVILQNLLNDTNTTLLEKDKIIEKYKDKVLVLSNSLTQKSDELNITQTKLQKLLTALDEKQSKYEDLLKELQSKREKIKYLTGIRLRIIDELKQTLGNSVNVTKDGALKLNSKILFAKGSSQLKEEAKTELQDLFTKYITALMSNPSIKENIDRIVIEGHTDSDGGYLYNLKLSQERALSVMNYLLTLPIAKKYSLEKYLTASGRSYLDRVIKNGVEDKEASRRIEFKFRLKNQNAFYEIEKILDENR